MKETHENPMSKNQMKNRFITWITWDIVIYMPCRFSSGNADDGRIFVV